MSTTENRPTSTERTPSGVAEDAIRRLEGADALTPVADALGRAADVVLPDGPVLDAARGRWLGHPVHPMLTDLPIGFWTSAFVLDLLPTSRTHGAADALVALGIVAAVPTAVAGLAELTALDDPATRRVAAAHAVGNAVGTLVYTGSLVARRRGRRIRGLALSWAAAGALTVGGHLGGHLAYRRAAGVSPAP
jgi:uncharacterized membrane protein